MTSALPSLNRSKPNPLLERSSLPGGQFHRSKVFHEGNWYSPTDNDSRKAIRKAFDEGQARITLDKGTWTFMRPVSHDYDTKSPAAEDVLNQAKSYVSSMPDTLPEEIKGKTRQEYRRHYYDEG